MAQYYLKRLSVALAAVLTGVLIMGIASVRAQSPAAQTDIAAPEAVSDAPSTAPDTATTTTDTPSLLIDYSGTQDMRVTDTSPLVKAILAGDETAVRAAAAQVNTPTSDGSYPLIVAVQHAPVAVVQILTGRNADVQVKDSKGRSAMHYAAMRGDAKKIVLLASLGLRAVQPDSDGILPLTYALMNKHFKAANALAEEAGADVNHQEAGRAIAFRVIAYKDRSSVAQWMIDHKLNLFARNEAGASLMDVAKQQKFDKTLAVLQSAYEQKLREYIEKQKAAEAQKKPEQEE